MAKYWKGKKFSDEHKKKLSLAKKGVYKEEGNPCWKGDEASYVAIHQWVKRWKGSPKYCEQCGSTTAKKFEWANIDHKYQRILDDYIRMCTSCHRLFDISNNNYQVGLN